MSIKRVKPGDRLSIPAAAYNAMADAAEAHELSRHNVRSPLQRESLRTTTVLVRNESGMDCERGGALLVDGVIIDPAANLSEFLNRVAVVGKSIKEGD